MKVLSYNRWLHCLMLLIWIAIGTGLRLTHLTAKPPWTDEFSTLVFSLGHSFRTVPLDEAISLSTLLAPLRPTPQAGIGAVVHHLMTESTHPPVYFILAHLWMKLFPPQGEFISLWAARSLAALLGVASIPAMFGLGCLAFRSRLIGQLAAAMMAVSPFGIFLAQETRHYTLAILWVIASLCCLSIATRAIHRHTPLPLWVGLIWVGVNSLGIATHYLFTLTLCAEAFVLIAQGWRQSWQGKGPWHQGYWWRIYVVAVGTFAGGLVWLPAWQRGYGSEITDWIYSDNRVGFEWLDPVFQALAAWITMLALLPVESKALVVVLVSGAVMLLYFIWVLPILSRGLRSQLAQPKTRLAVQTLSGFVLGAIALFFGITYGLGTDITRGARYSFVYFPAVVALLGASLAACWHTTSRSVPQRLNQDHKPPLYSFRTYGKTAVILIWLVGLLSGLTVVGNLGYRKYYRPDFLVPMIQERSQAPVLIATTYETHVQIGELMGIAWEFKRRDLGNSLVHPQFLLASQEKNSKTKAFYETLNQLPRPLDLWLVNFYLPIELEPQGCFSDSPSQPGVNGYKYHHYHCPVPD